MNLSKDATGGMAELVINPNGIIHGCNKAFERISGYLSSDILWKPVSMLLPQLESINLIAGKEINPRLRFLMHIGHRFDVIGLGGIQLASQLFINEIESLGQRYLRIIICPS
jgi:hypothetical protein